MDANELLKKVRKIEIKTRGLSHNIFAGEYHSAFKGRGVIFSEVREYEPGGGCQRQSRFRRLWRHKEGEDGGSGRHPCFLIDTEQ